MNGTLFRIFWFLLFVRASSLVTDEALLIALYTAIFVAPVEKMVFHFMGTFLKKGVS